MLQSVIVLMTYALQRILIVQSVIFIVVHGIMLVQSVIAVVAFTESPPVWGRCGSLLKEYDRIWMTVIAVCVYIP